MKVEAPIRNVRLLEDRALVTRVAELTCQTGTNRFSISAVSPVMADKTLMASCPADSKVSMIECRVVRRTRTKSEQSEPTAQQLADDLQALTDEIDALQTSLRLIEESERSAQGLLNTWFQATAQDVYWGKGETQTWQNELQRLQEHSRALTKERLKVESDLEDAVKERDKLNSRRQEKLKPSDRVDATLELTMESPAETTVAVEIEYVVPSACWRPCYSAQWKETTLHLESQACVWQNTGEDWSEVELSFSTQRSALGTSPPKLSRDLLRLQKKQKQVVVQAREESVIVKHKKAAQVPGIDDGGEVMTLRASHKVTVLSDGRPHRVPLSRFSSKLEQERLVLGELVSCVLLNTEQTNTGDKPLLPGPVELVKNSGLVGRTYLEYTSPGERFRLSWGAESSVSVHREQLEGKEETSMVSSWKNVSHTVKIHLCNLTTESQSCLVRERIPVSELKEVKIVEHPKKTTDQKLADSDGFVEWSVQLGANERRTLELHYDVQKKKKVVEAG